MIKRLAVTLAAAACLWAGRASAEEVGDEVRAKGTAVESVMGGYEACFPLPKSGAGCWEWTGLNWGLEGAWLLVLGADYLQTRDNALNPAFEETGPWLPRKPSVRQVNLWALSGAAIHAGVSLALPRGYREVWQLATFGMEATQVGLNFRFGIGFHF